MDYTLEIALGPGNNNIKPGQEYPFHTHRFVKIKQFNHSKCGQGHVEWKLLFCLWEYQLEQPL